jgi:transposase
LWRRLTRTKTSMSDQRKRIQAQVEGSLEEMMIKLSSVVSDLFGLSGRRILASIAAGEQDPTKLADLGDKRLRVSKEELQAALMRKVQPAHRLLLSLYLEQLELIDKHMSILDREISLAMRPHAAAIERLAEVPGLGIDSAQQIIAEIGPDAAFPSAGQVAS